MRDLWLGLFGAGFVVVGLLGVGWPARAAGPHAALDWMEKAYGDGRHNAFTDLIRWRGAYYLCFRHGESHGSMDGEIRVMRSPDMRAWRPCGTLDTWGDDRDPHFAATDEALYVYFGTWDLRHGDGRHTPDRNVVRSHFASSEDGETWSEVSGVYEPGWWLWRVKHHNGRFYSVAYTAVRPTPSQREARLLVSDDGLNWSMVSTITKDRVPTESDLWFQEDGSLWVVTRMEDPVNEAFLFRSDPARSTWTGDTTGAIIHAPAFAKWKDHYFVSGRGRQEGASVTKIWELVNGRARELITLPSGGDTSYPGLVVDPATVKGEAPALFVSWYSQHDRASEPNHSERTSSIYVGRVTIAP